MCQTEGFLFQDSMVLDQPHVFIKCRNTALEKHALQAVSMWKVPTMIRTCVTRGDGSRSPLCLCLRNLLQKNGAWRQIHGPPFCLSLSDSRVLSVPVTGDDLQTSFWNGGGLSNVWSRSCNVAPLAPESAQTHSQPLLPELRSLLFVKCGQSR